MVETFNERVIKAPASTPWTLTWSKVDFSIKDEDADRAAKIFQEVIDPNPKHWPKWYVDFKNERTHYIVYRNKIFKVNRSNKINYKPAFDHGLALGIPIDQFGIAD